MTTTINGVQYDSVSYIANTDMKNALWAQAQFATKAGALPPGVSNPEGYCLLVLAGIDLGILPTRAVATLHLLGGKVSISAQAMMGLANQAGVRMTLFETTDEEAKAEFTREGYPTYTTGFTITEARQAGLVKDKSAWMKQPRDMLIARTITRGLRYIAADVVTGIYSVEELNDGIQTVELSDELRAKYDTRDQDLAALGAQAITVAPQAAAPQKSRTDDHTAEVAAAAGVKPKQVTPPAVVPPATATATGFQNALPGRVTQADLDLTPGVHIELITKGQLPSVKETTATIFAAFKEIYPEEMAKSVLSEKVKSYGADAAAKLSPIDFMDLYRWADSEVAKVKAQDTATPAAAPDAPIEEQAPESPEHVPAGTEVADFNPHRGAATKPGGPVTDSAPTGNIDEEIVAAWQELAAKDREAEGDAVFEKFGYQVGAEGVSQQMRRLVLQELKQLQAA